MFQRREDESITQFTMRRLSHELISTELEDLARIFDNSIHEVWTSHEVAEYLRHRSAKHPEFDDDAAAVSNGDGT